MLLYVCWLMFYANHTIPHLHTKTSYTSTILVEQLSLCHWRLIYLPDLFWIEEKIVRCINHAQIDVLQVFIIFGQIIDIATLSSLSFTVPIYSLVSYIRRRELNKLKVDANSQLTLLEQRQLIEKAARSDLFEKQLEASNLKVEKLTAEKVEVISRETSRLLSKNEQLFDQLLSQSFQANVVPTRQRFEELFPPVFPPVSSSQLEQSTLTQQQQQQPKRRQKMVLDEREFEFNPKTQRSTIAEPTPFDLFASTTRKETDPDNKLTTPFDMIPASTARKETDPENKMTPHKNE